MVAYNEPVADDCHRYVSSTLDQVQIAPHDRVVGDGVIRNVHIGGKRVDGTQHVHDEMLESRDEVNVAVACIRSMWLTIVTSENIANAVQAITAVGLPSMYFIRRTWRHLQKTMR